MEFTPEQLQERYNQLPVEMRKILDSEETMSHIDEIARLHNLHIDQIGIVQEETTYVALGLRRAGDFVSAVARRAGMRSDEAQKLVEDINQKIFQSLRNTLREQADKEDAGPGYATQAPAAETPAEMGVNKDDILAEIENPTPVEHPISIAKEVPAFPTPKEILPEKTQEQVAHDFISQKLSGTMNMPQQTAATPEKPTEKPKGYAADPYREPLV